MPNDEERRKVARGMRMRAEEGYGFSGFNIAEEVSIYEAEYDDPYKFDDDAWLRLADLIDPAPTSSDTAPTCDRDALLVLAQEMDEQCGPWRDCGKHYASRIREACGETS